MTCAEQAYLFCHALVREGLTLLQESGYSARVGSVILEALAGWGCVRLTRLTFSKTVQG
ncbi:MAG: hypothetical protein IPP14_02445 [Planctomycetes bacterium]|nr:hypothetical protein [Planctomycetota bacterium]